MSAGSSVGQTAGIAADHRQQGSKGARTRPLARPQAPTSWTVVDKTGTPIPEVERFLVYLVALGRSPRTVLAYATTLHLFFQWLELRKFGVFEPTLDELANFFTWLRTRNLSPQGAETTSARGAVSDRTVNLRKRLLSTFYRFYAVRNPQSETLGVLSGLGRRWSDQIPVSEPQRHRVYIHDEVRRPRPKTITDEQVRELLDACPTARDRFLLHLLDQSGLRIGEALGLHHEDLSPYRQLVQVVPRLDNTNGARVKGMRPRQVPVPDSVFDSYARYMAHDYRGIDSDYVFVQLRKQRGTPQTVGSVDGVLRKVRAQTGISFTPQVARHSYATRLIRAGVPLDTVAELLGHADARQTRRTYIHLEVEDHRRVLVTAGILAAAQ